MKDNTIYTRTCAYNIKYHVVWTVKRKIPVISPEIDAFLRNTVMETANDKGFAVQQFETRDAFCVRCLVSAPPKLSITDIVKYLKGITGRKLMEARPELKEKLWNGELWNHSYYVETIGSTSEDNISCFLEKQNTCY